MNTHKAFILGVALLSTIGVKAQFAIDDYKAVFTSSPQHVPTTKTPDAPLAGNGEHSDDSELLYDTVRGCVFFRL